MEDVNKMISEINSYLNINRRLHYDKMMERTLLTPYETEYRDRLYELQDKLFQLWIDETIPKYKKRYLRLYCIVIKYMKSYNIPYMIFNRENDNCEY